jgi:hypothetical protein
VSSKSPKEERTERRGDKKRKWYGSKNSKPEFSSPDSKPITGRETEALKG